MKINPTAKGISFTSFKYRNNTLYNAIYLNYNEFSYTLLGSNIGEGILSCNLGKNAIRHIQPADLEEELLRRIPILENKRILSILPEFKVNDIIEVLDVATKRIALTLSTATGSFFPPPEINRTWLNNTVKDYLFPIDDFREAKHSLGTLGGDSSFIKIGTRVGFDNSLAFIKAGSREFGRAIFHYAKEKTKLKYKKSKAEYKTLTNLVLSGASCKTRNNILLNAKRKLKLEERYHSFFQAELNEYFILVLFGMIMAKLNRYLLGKIVMDAIVAITKEPIYTNMTTDRFSTYLEPERLILRINGYNTRLKTSMPIVSESKKHDEILILNIPNNDVSMDNYTAPASITADIKKILLDKYPFSYVFKPIITISNKTHPRSVMYNSRISYAPKNLQDMKDKIGVINCT